MNALITAAESRAAEAFAIERGVSGAQMMLAAGAATAKAIRQRFSPSETLVLCGPGNNGGDGFVIARLLRRWGWRTRIATETSPDALPADARAMARHWHGRTIPLDALENLTRPPQLVVDALFGAGLARDIDGVYARAIKTVAAWDVPVVAVDVPSGVDGDSGAIRGVALPAKLTVSFFRERPGHYLLPGRALRGALLLRDIGIPDAAMEVMDTTRPVQRNHPSLWRAHLPRLESESHKYLRGHVVVRGGGLPHAGAARLAARGALRCGAGMVTLASAPSALLAHASQETAVIVAAVSDETALAELVAERRVRAMVLGPGNGVGEETRRFVLTALGLPVALVLDADALTSFSDKAEELAQAIAKRKEGVVLTPHAGEFGRLFAGCKRDKLTAARQAAARMGAVLVYKGSDTVVADASGKAAIADNAPPSLSTAGSGDVLAGMIGGLLGTGMETFSAACCAVWMHGEAARGFGAGLIAEDLPERLPEVWQQLEENQDIMANP